MGRNKVIQSISTPSEIRDGIARLAEENGCNASEMWVKCYNHYLLYGGAAREPQSRKELKDIIRLEWSKVIEQYTNSMLEMNNQMLEVLEGILDMKIEEAVKNNTLKSPTSPEVPATPSIPEQEVPMQSTAPVKQLSEMITEARNKVLERLTLYGLEKKKPNSFGLPSCGERLQDAWVKWDKLVMEDNGHGDEEALRLEEEMRKLVETRNWGEDIIEDFYRLRSTAHFDRSDEQVRKKMRGMGGRRTT